MHVYTLIWCKLSRRRTRTRVAVDHTQGVSGALMVLLALDLHLQVKIFIGRDLSSISARSFQIASATIGYVCVAICDLHQVSFAIRGRVYLFIGLYVFVCIRWASCSFLLYHIYFMHNNIQLCHMISLSVFLYPLESGQQQ